MSRLAGQFSRIVSSSHLYGRLSLSLSPCLCVCVCVWQWRVCSSLTMDRCSIINDRTSLHNVWPTSSSPSPFSSSSRFVHFRLFFEETRILFSYLIRIFVHGESGTTRFCIWLERVYVWFETKFGNGESYVYVCIRVAYTGESSNETIIFTFGLITLSQFRSFIRVCNVEREGRFGNSSFKIYKLWKFVIYIVEILWIRGL